MRVVGSQVLSLQGRVAAVSTKGRRRLLRAHDRVAADERIELAAGAQVQLLQDDGRQIVLGGELKPSPTNGISIDDLMLEALPKSETVLMRRRRSAIAALVREAQLKNFQPEAGLQADEAQSGGGHDFYRVERLQERVPRSYLDLAPLPDELPQPVKHSVNWVPLIEEKNHEKKNYQAMISASPIELKESQRGVIDITDQVKVSDRDPGEARLKSMEKQSMKLTHGDNTEVDGAFFYSISSDGRFIVDARHLPPMREGDVFSATVNVASQDGTAGTLLQLKFLGENDQAQIEEGMFAISANIFEEESSSHKLEKILVA